jgi:OmpA-OmpF porin, OOP family
VRTAPTAQEPPPQPTTGATPQPRDAEGRPMRRVDDVRRARRETRDGDRTIIREPDRVIVREGGRTIIRHSEVDRFRHNARDVRVERRGAEVVTVVVRPDGSQIVTVNDQDGRLIRRVRRYPDRREVVIIDNRPRGPAARFAAGAQGYYVDLAPPVVRIPPRRYILEAQEASEDEIYDVLMAEPVEALDGYYTLDQVRYSPQVRARMPSVDLDTVTFDTGSWEVAPNQVAQLEVIAKGILRALERNPSEVFLIEGHTDAVGNEIDNLSLSDRRAEAVALVLTEQFGVPPENLVTQGYGEQYLKVQTEAAERRNRRVTARRITPLLAGADGGQRAN